MNRNLHVSKLFLEIQSGIFSLDFSKITFREDIIHPSQTNSIEENERIVSENPNTPYVDLMYFTKEQYTGVTETTQDDDIFVRMNIMGIKYNEDDVIVTVFTDSAEMYQSRLQEQTALKGEYTELQAALDRESILQAQSYDNLLELSYWDKKRIHNLKYYTWVEQQGKTYQEILQQWEPEYWIETFENNLEELDKAIEEFNSLGQSI